MTLLENDPIAGGASVPMHLRNAPTKLMKEGGWGKGYKYNPDYGGGRVAQEYLPEELVGRKFLPERHLGTRKDLDLEDGIEVVEGEEEDGSGTSMSGMVGWA